MILNLNEVKLMGSIDKIGDLKTTSYSMIEIILTIKQPIKNAKTGNWEEQEKKVAVIFFGNAAEEIATYTTGTVIFITGEITTRFKQHNGVEYANTSVQGKKYQVMALGPLKDRETQEKKEELMPEFDTDIPF